MGVRGSKDGRLGAALHNLCLLTLWLQTFLRALTALLHLEQLLRTGELLPPSPDTCPARAHRAWL